jgi:translation initiation factor IF-2
MRRALVAAVRFALANAPVPSRDPVAALPRWHRIPPLGSGGTGSFSNLPRAERAGWSARRHLATSTCAWRDVARDTRGDGGARRGKPGGGGGGGRGGSGGFGGGGGGGRDPSRTRDRPSKKPSSSFGGKKKSGAPMALPDRFAALAAREAELEGADPPIPGDTPGRPDGAGAQSKSKSKSKSKQRRKEAGGPIEILSGSTIAEVARALKTSAGAVEKVLADLGESAASAEEVLSDDLIELLALELGLEVVVKDDRSTAAAKGGDPSVVDPPRRAVVAVMGHVDHGKTTLLDTLRSSSVAAGEAGGITQHIGAFVVKLSGGGELTFLDTPGHAAFSAMRQRGAKCTDVAVLVCAADDGVMPQTREAAAHIQAANCRYVVAVTKCDAPGADPQRVRDELIAAGIPLEQGGGDVQCVDVSAVSGQGMEDLEMALFLEAEAMNLRARRDCDGAGVVLEARKDPSRGAVVTGLLRRGRLEVGACVVAGAQYGRVRRLVGHGGVDVDAIGPSEPFELAGLRGVPSAGDPIQRVGSEDRARRVARAREARATQARLDALAADAGLDAGTPRAFELEHTHAPVGARGKAAVAKMRRKSRLRGGDDDARLDDDDDLLDALDDDDDDASSNRDLCCIVKADVQGTAEAVRDAVLTLGSPAVGVKVVYVGVGPVTESDVSLAAAIGGPILAFNVREPPSAIAANAKRLGVPLVERKVIYHLLDAVGEMLGARAPEKLVESVAGEAEVRAVFDLSNRRGNKADVVAGCLVNVGALDGSERFRVMRDGSPAHEGLLECESIRRHKLEVTAVGKGTDCGVSLRWGEVEVRVGDVLQCVKMVKKKAGVERVATGGARVLDA